MIRAIPVEYYLDAAPSHMAFLNTVDDMFIEFNGTMVWESWDELVEYVEGDEDFVDNPTLGFLDRVRGLCPQWFLDA